ncbi:MAG TPA: glycosyltransferase [Flavobacteriales bacterium]
MWKMITGLLRSPQGRNSLFTYLTEGLAMLGMVLTYRLAAMESKADLDLYVIVRRTVSFAFPVILMGAMVGLTRFVSMSRAPEVARRYLRGAMAWVIPLSIVLVGVGIFLAKHLAWTIFGTYDAAPLILPLGLMTIGIALHGVAYGYLRGRGAVTAANLLQLAVLAVVPCLAFLLFDGIGPVLWFNGIGWILAALLSIVPGLFGRTGGPYRKEGAELLRYGLPRVPGDIALGALLTVPGYVALRTHGLDISAEVGFGATLLNIAAAVFSPVALLLLPAASMQLAVGDHAGLAARIRRMTWIILAASCALMLGFELLATPLLLIYLGHTGDTYVAMSRIIFIGALPFAFFNGMRSVLDAYYHTPRNGVNLMVSFLILLVGSAFHLLVVTPWYTMAVVLVIALFWLGWATWRDTQYVLSELDRRAARSEQDLSVMVVIPDEEDGDTFAASKAQARAFAAVGARMTFFHLESRTSPYRLWRSRRRLKRLLKERRPDVVQVHFGSVAALFTVLVSSVPVVVTFMGDDLDRKSVPGFARARVGGIFSQIAAFFAAGIICTDEEVRSNLWWRSSEAVVLPLGGDGTTHAQETLDHLRSVAYHRTADPAPTA